MHNRTRIFTFLIAILIFVFAFIPGQYEAIENACISIGTFCFFANVFYFQRSKSFSISESGKYSISITHSTKGKIVKIEVVEFENGNRIEWIDEKKGGADV